jgi:lipopolysaccharide/colanic/teichoic acid biosynthesis glycosyltransferase
VSQTTLTYEQVTDKRAAMLPANEQSRASAIACRTLDLAVALVALVLLTPLLLAIALWIRLDSRGPALFRQERRGRDMEPFVVNKFRSMQVNTPNDEHVAYVQSLIAGDAERKETLFKLVADERVTRAGRLLRKSSLDELPQLVNVLIGNMSLVGPRPCLDYELEKYPPHAYGRFAVKPGITGLWQVSGRSQLSFDEMIALDLDYAGQQSFWFNVRILLRTLPVVLFGRGAA